jgi:hypothetical protein
MLIRACLREGSTLALVTTFSSTASRTELGEVLRRALPLRGRDERR